MPFLERYWKEADPEYCDGERAESFSALLRRGEVVLDRLAFHPTASLIYIFSHGQFIQAVRSLVVDAGMSDQEKMRRFWRKVNRPPSPMRNGSNYRTRLAGGGIFLPVKFRRSEITERVRPR